MTARSRARFAEVVRADPVDLGTACALIAVETEPGLDVRAEIARLDALAERSAGVLADAGSPSAQATGLRVALGERAGFAGSAADYADLRSSLLHHVLRRRRGLPILLSIVWLEVARRLGVPAYGVGLPGHFVVAVGRPGDEPVLVDPFAGGRMLSPPAVAGLVRAAGAQLEPAHLSPWSETDILFRVLNNIRQLAARTGALPTQLWAVELALLLPSHPLALRRERGELLVELTDFEGGAAELTAYAEAVATIDPAGSERMLRDARLARARRN